ncbi:hypothetical protein QBC37DRAFT_20913 [Rhypophila decipiens]|uniref:CBM-cenC domain-containing protein n=1 Tax=Rhypophila decipiens TaxID=261697 RepID=A0AAN7B5H9_9PEZI|nr:hypothetical protein QBC37DRAFT_20913 [Rhypophila decipiens]
MRFSSTLLGGLLFGSSVLAVEEPECTNDAILECFSSSTAQARAYCTASLGLASTTRVVTVTPTVTVTEVVTATEPPTSLPTVTITEKRRKKRGVCTKRDVTLDCLSTSAFIATTQLASACSCLGVVATSTATAEPTTVTVSEVHYAPQSCAASFVFSTITQTLDPTVVVSTVYEVETQTLPASLALSTVTEVQTQTTYHVSEGTVYQTVVETVTATATQTDVSVHVSEGTVYQTVVETITATATQTDTAVSLQTTTVTETQTQTSVSTSVSVTVSTAISVSVSSHVIQPTTIVQTQPVTTVTTTVTSTTVSSVVTTSTGLANGNFEDDLDGWSVLSQSSASCHSETRVAVTNGGTRALRITSTGSAGQACTVNYGQVLSCTPGDKYRLALDYTYTYGSGGSASPWSITLGQGSLSTVITSTGAATQNTFTSPTDFTHTCGTTTPSNTLSINARANNGRTTTLTLDNFIYYKLT